MIPLFARCFAIAMLLFGLAFCATAETSVEQPPAADDSDEPAVHFSRDIRPLLSDHCFACHGPDENKRESGVRLDTAEGIDSVIDPDAWDESPLVERIRAEDSDMLMPPPDSHKPLSEEAKSIIERWIRGGAEFQAHWSFIPPVKADVPPPIQGRRAASITLPLGESARFGPGRASADVTPSPPLASLDPPRGRVMSENNGICRVAKLHDFQAFGRGDEIDRWIEATLAEKKLSFNGPSERTTLARRVALDLTGLPPTWQEVTQFVNDPSPEAYQNYVDTLLASPAYGEHMARYWLDLVRYGDTHGLHLDNYREMWPYRDWVMDAFNENKPFDVFITEQLAGDLLADSTDEQKIASGFNRLNVTTNEGGSIYDEVFARNVMDRTDAFGTVFLGLTTGCAVCHDHKFDPILQSDYYSLSAFFNSLDGRAMDGNIEDHPPVIALPSTEQEKKLAEISAEIIAIDEQKKGPLEEVDAAQTQWVQSLSTASSSDFTTIVPTEAKSTSGTQTEIVKESVIHLAGVVQEKDTIELIAPIPPGSWRTLELSARVDGKNKRVGTASNGNAVLSEIVLRTRNAGETQWKTLEIASASASRQQNDGDLSIEKAVDGTVDESRGWAVGGHQSEGGRNAWFRLRSPLDSSAEQSTEIQIQLHYQSKFAGHLLRDVQFYVHESATTTPAARQLVMGDTHLIGPLPIEDVKTGYDKELAGEKSKEFDPDSVVTHAQREYRWQHHAEILPIVVNALPYRDQHPSVTILTQTIQAPSAQTVALMIGSDDGYVVYLNGKQVAQSRGVKEFIPLQASHDLKLRGGENRLTIKHVDHQGQARLTYALDSRMLRLPGRLADRLVQVDAGGEETEQHSLRYYFRQVQCDAPQWLALNDMRLGMVKLQAETRAAIPTTLVWKETEKPRPAHLLLRGQYDAPGEVVPRAVPAFLPPLPPDMPVDRLALAKWLIGPEHPLTARVAVNRFWQQLFGTGLVKTSEDFGSQGTPPSHPELLDGLAIDFRESGWDVKALMRRLVMTRAYRRSAKATPEMLAVDPNNRLLARGPRFRLDAEMLRDQILSVSGLLVDHQGGPSVKPPQPAGLWAAVGYSGSNTVAFVADEGDKIYRRSVYTFWKRTSPPAVMATFDAPSRESCIARRERTNTPLQALLMLNEPQTLQASQRLARETIAANEIVATSEAPQGSELQPMRELFQRVVLRTPGEDELEALSKLLTDLTDDYSRDPEKAARLVGEPDPSLAAWTVVANTLLNLDEVLCK